MTSADRSAPTAATARPSPLQSHLRVSMLFGLVLLGALQLAAPVRAGAIEQACKSSDRRAASPSLCRCIQSVAERRLTTREQREVSQWFRDPQMAQDVRQSSKRADERLWDRYKRFGEDAAKICRNT